MFFGRSDPGFPQWSEEIDRLASNPSQRDGGEEPCELDVVEDAGLFGADELVSNTGYERALIESVWEFAEIVPGNDPSLWRKDEFGEWIHRLDYANRSSEFGWEVFDPGLGRHTQGVFAMRPMQWKNFLRQYDVFG